MTTRRGFVLAVGAAAAGAALPAPGLAVPAPATWAGVADAWSGAQEALLERFRHLYLAEVVRFAEELRPRFEAGELRGATDDDSEDEAEGKGPSPLTRLEDLCMEHFGVHVEREEHALVERAPVTAELIVGASPHADRWGADNAIPSARAAWSAAYDVIAVARVRGWYTPAADECPTRLDVSWVERASLLARA